MALPHPGISLSTTRPQRWSSNGPWADAYVIASFLLQPYPVFTIESYNIAIVGADAVGKTTFVQRALNLARPPVTNPFSVRIMVDSVTHVVTLLELDLEQFELNPSQPIQWPKQINGHVVPRVDAALVLYDVLSRNSIRQLPQMVGMCSKKSFPQTPQPQYSRAGLLSSSCDSDRTFYVKKNSSNGWLTLGNNSFSHELCSSYSTRCL